MEQKISKKGKNVEMKKFICITSLLSTLASCQLPQNTAPGTSPSSQYIPKDNNWQSQYGSSTQTPTTFDCPAPTGTGYDLRRGTITLAGGNTSYIPGAPSLSAFTHNISYFLTTTSKAKLFYETDTKLRVRFKVRPQPKPPVGETWCYNRQTGLYQDPWGYTQLNFRVSVVGLNADGSLKKVDGYPQLESTKYVTTNVGNCSEAFDFSTENKNHPHGMVLVIHDVQSDQSCWYNTDSNKCTGYKTLSRGSCWQMDIEASVDGTKDI